MRPQALAIVLLTVGGALSQVGCTTESYCFRDCEGDGTSGAGGTTGSDAGFDGPNIDAAQGGTGAIINVDGGPGKPDGCIDTELCNGFDDDCDGEIDEDIDFTNVRNCGNCATDCLAQLEHAVDPSCDPPDPADGTTPGTCNYGSCEQDFYDADGNPANGCEYYCIENPNGTNTTDPGGEDGCGKDDDCDGQIDEDVDLCDVDNCGACGKKCVILNGTGKCEFSGSSGDACTDQNTACEVDQCDPGWYDIDGASENGCEYNCTTVNVGPEICDGIDNDCDGRIDNRDPSLETDDPNVGADCFGGAQGECSTDAHKGVSKCIGGAITCCDVSSNDEDQTNTNFPKNGLRNAICDGSNPPFVLKPDEVSETCNNKDDDCDGLVDDSPVDAGGQCGSSVGSCSKGTLQCVNGGLSCQGQTAPVPDTCDGADNNCDGIIDAEVTANPPVPCQNDSGCGANEQCRERTGPADKVCVRDAVDAGGVCPGYPAPPSGATSPCMNGELRCLSASLVCQGEVGPTSTSDACGVDANCDGTLDSQPDLQNDPKNCGSCGNDCAALGGNSLWTCVAGTCTFDQCRGGFIECGGAPNDCETACSGSSGNPELCNGVDDDCNCQIDDNIASTPTPPQVCNVLPGATDPGCLPRSGSNPTGVAVTCSGGAWQCNFTSGYCDNSPANPGLYCEATADVCDGLDNNCNGGIDDNFQQAVLPTGYLGQDCASDDAPGVNHGQCRTTGVFVCNGPNATACNATPDFSQRSAELCDNQDNDCDGDVDEIYTSPGSQPEYVKPAVIQINSNTWVYQYEASRPGATANNPGNGNGWHSNPPAGTVAEATRSCSEPGVVPWFNLSAVEAAQTCNAAGGRLCELSDWQTACKPNSGCDYAYSPRGGSGSACQNLGNYPQGNPHCNIGLYDFDNSTPVNGSQGPDDGLLPTRYTSGSNPPPLTNCFADWRNLQGNPNNSNGGIYDMLGNLREITWNRSTSASNNCDPTDNSDGNCLFTLMGGAFNSQAESGATCDFTFYTVDNQFKLFDAGFRCCFDTNPSPP